MGNLIWRGDAKPVAQVVRITPENPEPGDTFTLKINGKQVEFVATDGDIATVVDGLVAAWNEAEFPEATLITAAAVDSDEDGESDYLTLTADNPGQPFSVETSTADAGGFQIDVETISEGDPGQNEIQQISIPSVASGGTFTLTFQGQTTAGIAYNASAAAVQSALEALSNIAAGDVIVGGASPTWTVEFDQAFANTNVATITGSGASLTGASSLTITTTQEGYPARNEIKSFTVPTGSSFTLWENHSLIATFAAGSLAAVVQSYLEGNYGAGNIVVTRSTSGSNYIYRAEFTGDLGGQNLPNSNSLQYTIANTNPANIAEWNVVQEGSSTSQNETQTVRINGGPTGGTFTLTFQGQTTAGIAYNASAATVKSELEALSNLDLVAVSLSGTTYTIEFQGTTAGTDVAQLTGSAASLTGGTVSVVVTQDASAQANEFQSISFSQQPGGGTFTLTWNPGGGAETTGAIAYDASAATVQTALEGLATPAPGDFTVTGADGGPWVVEFRGTYAGTNVAEITGSGASLTGGGSQSLSKSTTTRSAGPNHFDDPDNWTGESVPNALDSLFFNGGAADCLYGIRQRVTFTADASSDTLTFASQADFREDQGVRLFTSNTLPAGLSTGTTYYVKNLDYDAGTCQLSATAGGAAINITNTGTGTHTIALHVSAIKFHSRWTGSLGLTERNELDFYEYLPRSLAIIANTITIGEGEGDGQPRLDFDTGDQAVTITVYKTGGSAEPGLPAVRWKGTSSANDVTVHDGEFGVAVFATESAVIDSLIQHSGLIQVGTATLSSLTKYGGELTAENITLAGALQLHG